MALDLAGIPDLLRGAAPLILGAFLLFLAFDKRPAFIAGCYLFFAGVQSLALWIGMKWVVGCLACADEGLAPTARAFYMLGEATKLVPLAFGALFVASFPRPLPWIERRRYVLAIPFVVAIGYMAAFTLWRGFVTTDPRTGDLSWTWNEGWIRALETWGEIALLAGVILRLRAEAPGAQRESLALAALGMLAFRVTYAGVVGLSFVSNALAGTTIPWYRFARADPLVDGPWGFNGMGDLVYVPLGIFALVVVSRLRERGSMERALVVGLWTCFALGAIQTFVDAFVHGTLMIWSIIDGVGAIFVVLGVLRFVPLPTARHRVLIVAASVVLLGILYATTTTATLGLVGESSLGSFAAQSVGMASVAAVAIPAFRLSARAAGPLEDASHAHKLAVYRAALEDILETTPAEQDATTTSRLSRLRAELGISERDHAVILHVLRAKGTRAAASVLAPGSEFLGRYVIERSLGKGGFGETWLARDTRLGRRVAIKALHSDRIDAQAASAMVREMRALASVRHPNVVALHDIQEIGNAIYLIMEYAEGGSMRQVISERGALPIAEVRRHADELLAALEVVHARGLLHRDVKPSNILLREGQAILADFGSAARAPGEGVGVTMSGLATATASGAGTLAYAAPELLRGAPGDARADLYSLCASLAEMATARPYLPLAGMSDFDARHAILTREPDLAGIRDPALRDLLRVGLSKDPDERWASAAEARRAIASVPTQASVD